MHLFLFHNLAEATDDTPELLVKECTDIRNAFLGKFEFLGMKERLVIR
ncbi:MAG: hypothetical protein ACTSV5_11095 [Promethearchaeota archaeon]